MRTDGNNAVFVHIQGGVADVYPTLHCFIKSVYLGQDSTKFTCEETDLDELYHSSNYDYASLRELSEKTYRAKKVTKILNQLNEMNLTEEEAKVVVMGISRLG